uniref:DUF834 domain-containing protein n=1 Tax=Oryza meridionalis TaxID=40149 RepID=A0A0E0F3S7_9ORYZ
METGSRGGEDDDGGAGGGDMSRRGCAGKETTAMEAPAVEACHDDKDGARREVMAAMGAPVVEAWSSGGKLKHAANVTAN